MKKKKKKIKKIPKKFLKLLNKFNKNHKLSKRKKEFGSTPKVLYECLKLRDLFKMFLSKKTKLTLFLCLNN